MRMIDIIIKKREGQELTSKEIGKILGVSDSRVSQLHTKAILRLRGRLSRIKEALMQA